MSDAPRVSKLGPHGGYRRPKTETAGQDSNATLKSRGREYVIERLIRDQRFDLVEAIEQRQVTAFAVACQLGWRRRRNIRDPDLNKTKLREFAMATALSQRSPTMLVHSELPCLAC